MPPHLCARLVLPITALGLLLGGCASRPVNPPIAQVEPTAGYRYQTRPARTDNSSRALVVLAFSGGGTRAAAYSYGVLEELRRIEIVSPRGSRRRLLDEVDIVTGVSGGSFTALAYGLYGERLFDEYERRFLKRDVQGELLARFLSPANWPALWSESWGRSEMATQLYNEILFENATFGDLQRKPGPLIVATATDISSGSRLGFTQPEFDLICSDLSQVELARAAASSSAVPLVLSPVTFNNYGGTCGYRPPPWAAAVADPANRIRPAGRALQRYKEMLDFQDGANRPYLHLVDGGISDNLGMRAVLEALESWEAARKSGFTYDFDSTRRVIVFVVNSLSIPKNDWDRHEGPPNDIEILVKAAGVPIDRYSYEAVELLKDLIARWQTARAVKASGAFAGGNNPVLARAADVPDIDIYAIDVSFSADPDATERAYLNDLPTSFVLTDEAVDRLRASAARTIRSSADFQRLLREIGLTAVTPPLVVPVPASR
jgi:NTE family protein